MHVGLSVFGVGTFPWRGMLGLQRLWFFLSWFLPVPLQRLSVSRCRVGCPLRSCRCACVCRVPVRLFHFHPVAHCGYHCRLRSCYCPLCRLSLLTGAVRVHVGAVVLGLKGCQMTLVLLIPTLRCLLVCTRMLFCRSPGICSMTYSLFLFWSGGVSMPFLQLLSGLSFFVASQVLCGDAVVMDSWSRSASGEAL